MYSPSSPSPKPSSRGINIAWCFLSLIEVLLAARFILKLYDARPIPGLTSVIYALTDVIAAPVLFVVVAPMLSLFHMTHVPLPGGIFEWTTLLAMFIYWLTAAGLSVMFRPIPGKGSQPVQG